VRSLPEKSDTQNFGRERVANQQTAAARIWRTALPESVQIRRRVQFERLGDQHIAVGGADRPPEVVLEPGGEPLADLHFRLTGSKIFENIAELSRFSVLLYRR
jgi:hypothetical protein